MNNGSLRPSMGCEHETPFLIELPKITDQRGNLSFLESSKHVPFVIKRTCWIYDVPGGETRGGHAYRKNEEFVIALSGSFDVAILDCNERVQTFSLNRSYYGLFLPKMTWREMRNFSTNSLALVLSSMPFDDGDYIRDFNEFRQLSNRGVANA